LTKRVKLGVDLVFGNRALISNQVLEFQDFLHVLCLKTLDVLLGNLNIRLQFKQVNQELTLVSQLLLVHVDDFLAAGCGHVSVHVEEHRVLVRLLHDVGDLHIEVADQVASVVIYDFVERLEAYAALSNVVVEKTDPNHDVGQLTELGDFLRGRKRDERPQAGTRQDGLESSGHFSLNRVVDRLGELKLRVVTDDVLLVLVK
jgi:hypothetical protein